MNGPEITAPTSITVDEDSQNNAVTGFTVTDADGENITVTLSAEGLLTLGQTTGLVFSVGDGTADGTMTLTGSAANINAALAGLIYSPTADDDDGDAISISVTGSEVGAGSFSSTFALSDLLGANSGDGSEGFVIEGADGNDESGWSVSNAGDVNGDGIDDLIIGAIGADPDGDSDAGESYVVFGSNSGFSSSLDLGSLNGSNGFTVKGVDAGDQSGWSVSNAGDLNNDGIDDIIIGAKFADAGGDSNSGEAYVVFGSNSFGSTVDLASLNGSNGFTLSGINVDDFTGVSVSAAGDVNGDGIDDVIIGADFADGDNTSDSGESYVVFGRDTAQNGNFASNFDLSSLNGSNGVLINGAAGNDHSGTSVSAAGDINGDGIADLIIGAFGADDGSDSNVGKSFVVFGTSTGFSSGAFNLSTLESSDGSAGFVIIGEDGSDVSGSSVSNAGDVNGDGIDDLIIGAEGHDSGGDGNSGASYVVFGTDQGFGATLNLSSLNGNNGFKIEGIDGSDESGFSVSSAGDVNGDGIADLLIGAPNGDAGDSNSGETYVVFGRDTTEQGVSFSSTFDLSTLSGGNGANGFIIEGVARDDFTGFSVSAAGDINGDGIDDLIVGARAADGGGDSDAGQSFVIFGRAGSTETTVNGTITVNINPDNDAPTISGDQAIAVDEGGSVVLTTADFVGTDIDDALADLTYSVSGLSNGTIQVDGVNVTSFTHTQLTNGEVSFVHDGSETTTGVFNVSVADDDNASSATIAIAATVTPTNDAPTISGDQAITVNEGESVVLTTADIVGADIDDATTALTYSVSSLSNGAVQVGGVDVTSFTHAQLVNGDVSFVHDGSQTLTGGFDVSVADDDNASSSSITITATVDSQNDAPTISGDQAIAVDEGGAVVLTTTDFVGADVDDNLSDLTYQVSNLSEGTIQVGGVDVTSFTQAQLVNGDVSFVQNGSSAPTAGFDVTVQDDDLASSSALSITATVTPTNDAPTVSGDGAIAVVEGGSIILSATDFLGTDEDDDDASLIYRITNETGGEVQVNGVAVSSVTFLQLVTGEVTFVHDRSDTGTASFDVIAEDDEGTQSTPFTITATVTPINDAPTISGDQAIAMDEGNSVVITTADLVGADVDDALADLTYAVSSPSNGTVQVNGVDATTFTHAQLVNGEVTFLHDGSETTTGGFSVSVADDDDESSSTIAITATVTPTNDAPTVSGDGAIEVNEGGTIVLTSLDFVGSDVDDAFATKTYRVSDLANGEVLVNGVAATSFSFVQLINGDVSFVHDGSETITGGFDVIAEDDEGAQSAPFAVTATVTPINDVPTISGDFSLTLNQGDSIVLTTADFVGADNDDVLADLTYAVSAVQSGSIQIVGAAVGSFTHAQLMNGEVSFVHDGSGNTSGTFEITVIDDELAASIAASIAYTIAPPNIIDGTSDGDILVGTDLADEISGFDGSDILDGGTGNDLINGDLGDDFLQGDAGRDTLLGGEGDDTLRGGDDDDRLEGGVGDDFLLGDNGNDFLQGNAGRDLIRGGVGNDEVRGGKDDDILEGGDGNDTLIGAFGDDFLQGNTGDDMLFGGDGDDTIGGGQDNDTIEGGNGADVIKGGLGNDFLQGNSGNDVLFGGDGDDVVRGGKGDDMLNGGAGKDTVFGALGNDIITGGLDADTFIFNKVTWGNDIIQDFEDGLDLLDMRGTGATSLGDLTVTQLGANALIEYNGSSITLVGLNTDVLDASDFIF